jgi:hypothetical protein
MKTRELHPTTDRSNKYKPRAECAAGDASWAINQMDETLFAKLMAMTTSSYDHEALTALRKANAMLARDNLNWQGVVDRKVIDLRSKAEPAKPKTTKNKNQPPRSRHANPRTDSVTTPTGSIRCSACC